MMLFKNTWGSPDSGIDQQRADMFRVSVNLPPALAGDQGFNVWDKEIAWAIEKVTLPDRDVEAVPVKYLQQTNYQPGADVPSAPVDMVVRYAFAKRTATVLERWHNLVTNKATGGVGLASRLKTNGMLYWLVPNPSALGAGIGVSANVGGVGINVNIGGGGEKNQYRLLRAYELHGCWPKNLKPSEADMTTGNGLVTLSFSLQIDRYYPVNPEDLAMATVPLYAMM